MTRQGREVSTRSAGNNGDRGGSSRRSRRGVAAVGQLNRLRARLRSVWMGALERPWLWLTLWLVIGTWALLPRTQLSFDPTELEVGAVAERDYLVPVDLRTEDFAATEARRQLVRDGVLQVWDYDSAAAGALDARLEALFIEGRRLQAKGEAPPEGDAVELATRLSAATHLDVTPEVAEVLRDWQFADLLEQRLRELAAAALERGIVDDKDRLLQQRRDGVTRRDLVTGEEVLHLDVFDHLGLPEDVQELLAQEARRWSQFTRRQRIALTDFLLGNLSANLRHDAELTRARQEKAMAAVQPVMVSARRGQILVRKGDRIDAHAVLLLSQLTPDARPADRLLRALGTGLGLLLAALVLWLGLRRERVADQSRERVFGEALTFLLLSVLGTRVALLVAAALGQAVEATPFDSVASYTYAVPFAALAILAVLLLGRPAALLLSLLYSLLGALLVEADAQWWMVYAMAGSLAAIFHLDKQDFKQRMVLVRVGGVVGLCNLVLVLILTSVRAGLDADPVRLGFDLLCALLGGLLVAAVVSFAVPVLETAFGITTDIKLVELANTNLPLLRRLAFEAPGTFQHSLMVANLAKEGCDVIGADSVLAYTGALYHDVGKIYRPEYFIENQRAGRNRHDKLLPSMSALILINHVKEGLALARENNLPQPVCDAITQHHGTRLIHFFYNRAMEASRDGEAVPEDDFRYPGPKPRDRVMAVLMLADGVEAASRTLQEPSAPKIRTLVRKIVDDCLREGQLDECEITLADLRKVADAFQRVLETIYHRRIDYPGFDFNARDTAAEAADNLESTKESLELRTSS